MRHADDRVDVRELARDPGYVDGAEHAGGQPKRHAPPIQIIQADAEHHGQPSERDQRSAPASWGRVGGDLRRR